MALILDTNALSAFADGDAGLQVVLSTEDELGLPSIVLGEYLFGIRQSRYRRQYERWLEQYLDIFSILQVGSKTAGHYADIRSELKLAGSPIPSNDIWIAAITRERRCKLATKDTHFKMIRDVNVLSW